MGVCALLFLLTIEPLPASSQPSTVPSSEPASPAPMPIRFGLWLGPVAPTAYRQEKIAGAGQLLLEYWFNPYAGIKAAVGLGAASTAFFIADVGAVFDFIDNAIVVPY